MPEYFKPWRRKIGCVTLAMACVFAAGWVKSEWKYDFVTMTLRTSTFKIGSLFSYIKFIRETALDKKRTQNTGPLLHWHSGNTSSIVGPKRGWDEGYTVERNSECFGFSNGSATRGGSRFEEWIVPYWSIVIPLTLISAYLLLSQSRISTPRKLAEPAGNEVA